MAVDGTILWQLFLAVSAIAGIAAFVVKMYKIAVRLDKAIGVDSKGRTLSDRMERVEHQLWENGGSSLADRVNRIDATTNATTAELGVIKDLLSTIVESVISTKAAK